MVRQKLHHRLIQKVLLIDKWETRFGLHFLHLTMEIIHLSLEDLLQTIMPWKMPDNMA